MSKEPVNIIKLAVGVDDISHLYDIQRGMEIDYGGHRAVPCWTRYKPKRADEIIDSGGSLYRVVKNRIVSRQKILGFEMVETEHKGTMCAIMQDVQIIETVNMPKRPFQGWRYLKISDTPQDKGVYDEHQSKEEMPEDLAKELKEAGII